MSTTDSLHFPSGRSVANCKKDAKRLSKTENLPLHKALDRIAAENGLLLPFHKALEHLKNHATQPKITVMTRTDIQSVLDVHPLLTHFGIDLYRPKVRAMNTNEHKAEIDLGRKSLLNAIDECNRACQYLMHMQKRKSINTGVTSYGLKHCAERFQERMGADNPYVANGTLICAAIYLGFDIKQVGDSPNVHINFSNRSPVVQWEKLNAWNHSVRFYSRTKDNKLALLEREFGFPNPHQPLIQDELRNYSNR